MWVWEALAKVHMGMICFRHSTYVANDPSTWFRICVKKANGIAMSSTKWKSVCVVLMCSCVFVCFRPAWRSLDYTPRLHESAGATQEERHTVDFFLPYVFQLDIWVYPFQYNTGDAFIFDRRVQDR